MLAAGRCVPRTPARAPSSSRARARAASPARVVAFSCARIINNNIDQRPFSAEGYSEMSTENQMSSEIPAYSEIIQAPVLIYNIFSSQNPQFPYMKKPNPPMVGLE